MNLVTHSIKFMALYNKKGNKLYPTNEMSGIEDAKRNENKKHL